MQNLKENIRNPYHYMPCRGKVIIRCTTECPDDDVPYLLSSTKTMRLYSVLLSFDIL